LLPACARIQERFLQPGHRGDHPHDGLIEEAPDDGLSSLLYKLFERRPGDIPSKNLVVADQPVHGELGRREFLVVHELVDLFKGQLCPAHHRPAHVQQINGADQSDLHWGLLAPS